MPRALMSWIKIVLIMIGMGALTGALKADVLKLTNGDTFRGKIVSQTDAEVQLQSASGGVLTFPRSQIESIEMERPLTPGPGTASPAEGPGGEAKDFEELRDRVQAAKARLKKLRDEFEGLRKGIEEVAGRTQQEPAPRGDKPGQPPSKLELVDMRWSRAGDAIKVQGAIKNNGGSPGKWSRVIAVVKDLQGNVIGQGDARPVGGVSRAAVRGLPIPGGALDVPTRRVGPVSDISWVLPGQQVPIDIFVPFGGSSSENVFTTEAGVKRPRRMPRHNEITVEWKLETPPKYKEGEEEGGEAEQPK
jgi:hypothetical protein